ncbi:MAG: hypothetical protein KKC29_09450, partial [Alphaproteobacteria bacterium]|nr:hypothetical protein [Alphaproteobacteria bacterium]
APKFEHPKKNFTPRARPDGSETATGERPKRVFKPREDQFIDRPRGDARTGARPAARSDDRPGDKRPFDRKPDGKPPFAGKPGGSRPGGFSKPGSPRPGAGPAGGRGSPRPGAGPAGGRGSPRGPRSKD